MKSPTFTPVTCWQGIQGSGFRVLGLNAGLDLCRTLGHGLPTVPRALTTLGHDFPTAPPSVTEGRPPVQAGQQSALSAASGDPLAAMPSPPTQHFDPAPPTSTRWPAAWRFAIVALAVLILCSCRGPGANYDMRGVQAGGPGVLPPEAFTGAPPAASMAGVPCVPPMGPPGMEDGVPMPYQATGPWRPSGIAAPWPQDEYVCDGGDAGLPAQVGNQHEVRGLDMEDAVAHFDTLEGRTVVQPSNRVCLYAPRFAAVRQVSNARVNDQQEQVIHMAQPVRLYAPRESIPVGNAKQNLQVAGEIGRRPAEALRTRQSDGVLSNRLLALAFVNDFKAFENFTAIRTGVMVESEAAFLTRSAESAVAWISNQAVQVILDHKAVSAQVGNDKPELFFTDVAAPARPRLRVIKVASTPFAEPGDEVSFTLRFDNVGNQPIGNVTILDSLNTRLEYVPDSAQCSLDSQFSTHVNEGDSVVVRCDLADPLPPGKGGILRFRCRVR